MFILNSFKFIIQALLVITAVLIFSYFDPLGWFESETKLAGTPVSVKSVKEIGQLVTAEYYGEAIASLKETYLRDDSAEVMEEIIWFHDTLAYSLMYLKKIADSIDKKQWFNVRNYITDGNADHRFKEHFPDLSSNPLMEKFLTYYNNKSGKITDNFDRKYDQWLYKFYIDVNGLDSKGNKDQRKPVYRQPNDMFNNYFSFYKRLSEFKVKNRLKEEKKEIVMLGRGWVKAGIDFSTFNEKNFFYNPNLGVVTLFHISPKVLSCDINPWFLPGEKIRGFEFIKVTSRTADPQDIMAVKALCREKLYQQAIERNIIDQAYQNSKETLRVFFSLLIGSNVNEVRFVNNKYDVYLEQFLSDSVFSVAEVIAIDSIMKDTASLDTIWFDTKVKQDSMLKKFIRNIKGTTSIIYKNHPMQINGYSSLVAKILLDDRIDSSEIYYLKKNKKRFSIPTKTDNWWFTNQKEQQEQFEIAYQMIIQVADTSINRPQLDELINLKVHKPTRGIDKLIDQVRRKNINRSKLYQIDHSI